MGSSFIKIKCVQDITLKTLAPGERAEALVTCFAFLTLAARFFLIKKGKMGQLERIFTTVRINTRPCKLINFIIEERTLPLPMTVSGLYLELSLNIEPW